MRKKNLVCALLAGAMALSLTACSGNSGAASTTAAAKTEAKTEAAKAEEKTEAAKADAAAAETDWPKSTVTVTLPYNAGGDTDTYCRLMCQKLSDKFGQNFVVVNMTGGSGIVAAKSVMAMKPDGYNLLFNHTGASLVQEATGVADFSYTDNFTNVATIAEDNTYVVVVKKGTEWDSTEKFVEYGKANPGKLRFSNVFGSATHHVGLQMEKSMGIDMNELDVGTGSAERLAAFMGDQVDVLAANYMNVRDYVEKGDFVILGVCAHDRIPGAEDFPTFEEQGYEVITRKNYEVKFPKGADPAIVAKLSAAIKEISEDPEFAETLEKYYAAPYYRDAETMTQEDVAEVAELKEYFAGVELK